MFHKKQTKKQSHMTKEQHAAELRACPTEQSTIIYLKTYTPQRAANCKTHDQEHNAKLLERKNSSTATPTMRFNIHQNKNKDKTKQK